MPSLDRSVIGRFAVSIALLTLVGLAGVHFDVARDRHWDQPQPDQLARDYDRYVGEETLLFGTVLDHGDDWLRIEVESDAGTFEMRVQRVSDGVSVAPGGVVQVYGTLQPGHRIVAADVVVVNSNPWGVAYKYAVSILGVLLFLAVFFRYWTVNWTTLSFEPRHDG